MNIQFESFKMDYAPEVEKMILALYKEDPEGKPITKKKIKDTFRQMIDFPQKGFITVFKVDGNVIGYALMILYWSNEYGGDILNIDELYVKQEWRGKGIATKFFEYLDEKYNQKVAAFGLEVTPSNNKALNYYKQLGFYETDNTHMIKD